MACTRCAPTPYRVWARRLGLSAAIAATMGVGTSNAFVANATLVLAGGVNRDLLVQADATIDNLTNATPAVAGTVVVGVGASLELNAGNYATAADIQNAAIQGRSLFPSCRRVTTRRRPRPTGHPTTARLRRQHWQPSSAITTPPRTSATPPPFRPSRATSPSPRIRSRPRPTRPMRAAMLPMSEPGRRDRAGGHPGRRPSFAANTMNVGGTVTVTANTQTFMDADAVGSAKRPETVFFSASSSTISSPGNGRHALGPAPIQFNQVTAVDDGADVLNIPAARPDHRRCGHLPQQQ